LAAAGRDPRAALAVAMFSYAIRKAIGAFAAAMGGLDLLVFTGGIGAHAALVRTEACSGLETLGVLLDPSENQRDAARISAPDSRCTVRVIFADEESTMAREARALLSSFGDSVPASRNASLPEGSATSIRPWPTGSGT